jgi:cytochrome c
MSRAHGLWDVKGKPDVSNVACMKDCPGNGELRSEFPEHASGSHGNLAEQTRNVGATKPAPGLEPGKGENPTPSELAKRKGCLACHGIDKRIVGPAFKEVAARYRGQRDAEAKLLEKIRRGGSGVWGPLPMPPNPDLEEADARRLIQWVLGGV